jgi:SPP1 gp7 family putative phage head morphogenesis protein
MPEVKEQEQILSSEDRKKLAAAYVVSLLAVIEAEWLSLPSQIRAALETSAASGFIQGMRQVGVADAAMIAAGKDIPIAYARARSSELIGMEYDLEGNLVENANAEWSIAATSEARIKEIVEQAFAENETLEQITAAIDAALQSEAEGSGIFSANRAMLIAQTEIEMSQNFGNYEAWKLGGVERVRWSWAAVGDERTCTVCAGLDGLERTIGEEFPDGSLHPPVHPNCRCSVTVVK